MGVWGWRWEYWEYWERWEYWESWGHWEILPYVILR